MCVFVCMHGSKYVYMYPMRWLNKKRKQIYIKNTPDPEPPNWLESAVITVFSDRQHPLVFHNATLETLTH